MIQRGSWARADLIATRAAVKPSVFAAALERAGQKTKMIETGLRS